MRTTGIRSRIDPSTWLTLLMMIFRQSVSCLRNCLCVVYDNTFAAAHWREKEYFCVLVGTGAYTVFLSAVGQLLLAGLRHYAYLSS